VRLCIVGLDPGWKSQYQNVNSKGEEELMRSATGILLVVATIAWAVAGCVGDATSPADPQATEQPLQAKGVYYLQTTGTAEKPMFTFYDQNKVVIGHGRGSQNPQLTEIQWRGNDWERTDGAFSKNGVALAPDSTDAVELDAVLTVFELSLDQAFPSNSSNPKTQVRANSSGFVHPPMPGSHSPEPRCTAQPSCWRPNNRCTGKCTGFVCSATDGTKGFCL
jgi:hypothetical protein